MRPYVGFPLKAYLSDSVFPPELHVWRGLAERFRLDAPHGWPKVLAAATFMAGRGVTSPLILADIQPAGLEALCSSPESDVLVRALRGIARTTFPPAASPTNYLTPPGSSSDSLTLPRAAKLHAPQYAKA